MKDFVKLIVVLTLIASGAGLLLSLVEQVTRAPIAEQHRQETLKALLTVLPPSDNSPDVDSVTLVTGQDKKGRDLQRVFYRGRWHGDLAGVAFKVVAPDGYSGNIEIMVGDRGPVAIMSEIPSLKPVHRDEVLELSRQHSARFEEILKAGIEDGSISPCDVRMTGNAIMGSINWIPKWNHGDSEMGNAIATEFPAILTKGLRLETT